MTIYTCSYKTVSSANVLMYYNFINIKNLPRARYSLVITFDDDLIE